jgi:hypothetical protein
MVAEENDAQGGIKTPGLGTRFLRQIMVPARVWNFVPSGVLMLCGQSPGASGLTGKSIMRMSHLVRASLVALAALAGASVAAHADEGSISLRIYKAGFVVGGSGGSGVLTFHGRQYPLSTPSAISAVRRTSPAFTARPVSAPR